MLTERGFSVLHFHWKWKVNVASASYDFNSCTLDCIQTVILRRAENVHNTCNISSSLVSSPNNYTSSSTKCASWKILLQHCFSTHCQNKSSVSQQHARTSPPCPKKSNTLILRIQYMHLELRCGSFFTLVFVTFIVKDF